MRIGVIQFPGTNCERETAQAIRRAGMDPVHHRWNMDKELLSDYDGFVIAGGFSYEDRSRSGIIAAQDPIMDQIKQESRKGKPVLGICNGAQILVESGLVPGAEEYAQSVALTTNRRMDGDEVLGTGFYNAWINIRLDESPKDCAFTLDCVEGEMMKIPAAHAEGRFLIPDELLSYMIEQKMTIFRYADDQGDYQTDFPVNPNGSVYNIAGICNREGTVLALMPHPERVPEGDRIFSSMRMYIERFGPFDSQRATLSIDPEVLTGPCRPERYIPETISDQVVIALVITDNEAVSVENALRQRGIAAAVKKHVHWEISYEESTSLAEREEILKRIDKSGELYNSNKEFVLGSSLTEEPSARSFLVREKEDCIGDHTTHALKSWFSIEGIAQISHGVIWTIIPDDKEHAEQTITQVENTHLLANPIAHRRMIYEDRSERV